MVGPLRLNNNLDTKGFLRPGDKRDIFIHTFELEKVSLYKVKPLYEALHNLLADDGWQDPRGGANFEDLYWESINGQGMKDIHVWWRMIKFPRHSNPSSKHPNFRYALKIDFQGLAITKAEMAYEGKKKKVENADFVIRFWMWVQFDWQDKIKNSIFKNFSGFIQNRLMKKEVKYHKDWLYNYGEKLRGIAKDYLEMEEAGERPRLFHPEGGFKNQF